MRTGCGNVFVFDAARSPRHVGLGGEAVVAIDAARYMTLAVGASGRVYSWQEHWHTGWAPQPTRLEQLSQVSGS